MARRRLWSILILAVGAVCVFEMRHYLPRIYRMFVPVGEVQINQVRGINGVPFRKGNVSEFDFYVAGHIYGTQAVKDGQPDTALLAALPSIVDASPEFLVSLGDMAEQSNTEEFDILDKAFLEKMPFPVFNTVGNHDAANRELYEARYGKTFFTFKYGPARIILLDTEETRCSVNETQSAMLSTSLAHALRDPNTQYIFIFMHKTLFFKNDLLAAEKAPKTGPNEWKCYNSKKFNEIMNTIIIPAAFQKPVHLFAGDVGAWGNLTPYYEKHPDLPLFMYMTGLGDTDDDNILHVYVNDSQVNVDVVFLNTMTPQPVEKYDPTYWENVAREEMQSTP